MTYLVVQEAPLHPVVGADLLENVPGELLVQLPSDEAHTKRAQRNDDWDSDEKGQAVTPELSRGRVLESIMRGQCVDGLPDLVDLDDRVQHHGQVRHADSDDLDGVLHPQGIPDEHYLVQEAEDEKCQECRDRLGWCTF